MVIQTKRKPYSIPRYSLTGDLLSFLECEIQYRFNSKGSMPPSTPVQMWFGDFIHGVMEVAFNEWKDGNLDIDPIDFEESQRIAKIVAERLEDRGLKPYWGLYIKEDTTRKKRNECNANLIAYYSLYFWAPHLFPLINDNEVKMEEVRDLNGYDQGLTTSDRYAVEGIVDVISTFDVTKFQARNPLVKALMLDESISDIIGNQDEYEIIMDYKGMERPSIDSDIWKYHEWQLHTYMWLRSEQLKSKGKKTPVLAGVLLYLNELYLSKSAIKNLQDIVKAGRTDIMPTGDNIDKLDNKDRFSGDFRIKRSVRVLAFNPDKIRESLFEFDNVVQKIESNVIHEMEDPTNVWNHWNGKHFAQRCTACDLKTFCPHAKKGNYSIRVP